MQFRVELLDTWNMNIDSIDRTFTIRQPNKEDYVVTDEKDGLIEIPDRPWMALRITRLK
jgi:hypothetical protein